MTDSEPEPATVRISFEGWGAFTIGDVGDGELVEEGSPVEVDLSEGIKIQSYHGTFTIEAVEGESA